MKHFKTPQDALRYHVSGAIERGEGKSVEAVTPNYYGLYFCDPKTQERTACLILNDAEHPTSKSVSEFSRLFPYSEAPKMKRMVMTRSFKTWDEAWNHCQRLLNNSEVK